MSFLGVLRHLLRGKRFRELFTVRVTSQFGDGVFQIALASYVLFSPEEQADAASIAGAVASVLLPFSVVGPFAGVILDRWDRRLTLARFNMARAVPVLCAASVVAAGGSNALLFSVVIVAFGLNRFLLAGLSASLPRVVDRADLVMANSVTPTSGTIAYMCGLGAGATVRQLLAGSDRGRDVLVIVIGASIYAIAGLLALRIPRRHLGPDVDEVRSSLRHEIAEVARGLVAGIRHLRERRQAGYALGVIAAHRFWYGLVTVATVLLYRNTFEPDDSDAALAALSVALLASGLGYFAAAILTPIATARIGPRGWILSLLGLGAVIEVFPAMLYTQTAIVATAFLIGLSAQGVKICVDTLVQTHVDDAFRGRVFSIYDVLFNLAWVSAAAVGALVIPTDGKSYALLAGASAGFLVAALAYATLSRPLAEVDAGNG
jgi:MFS family permease